MDRVGPSELGHRGTTWTGIIDGGDVDAREANARVSVKEFAPESVLGEGQLRYTRKGFILILVLKSLEDDFSALNISCKFISLGEEAEVWAKSNPLPESILSEDLVRQLLANQ